MKIIDFHTHIFPQAIAARTIAKLETNAGIKAHTNGMADGLRQSMEEAGVDWSVVLPVVTNPQQFSTVNRYAAANNGRDGIISFGGIHPDSGDYKMELRQIKQLGLQGIKLHPDYQEVMIDDIRNIRIIDYACELGLIVVLHAGIDIGMPELVHCPPDRGANMLKQVDAAHGIVVFAHTGGYMQWDDVERYLVGRDIWLDTSYTLGMIEENQFRRIVENHGADRVLFATDSPWGGQRKMLGIFQNLGFPEDTKNKILGLNASGLLKLPMARTNA